MRNRLSRQELLIRDVLAGERCHLTADEIVSRLPASSTATVYRCLEQLTARGMIRKLSFGSRKAVYEYLRDPHAHLVCTGCGSIQDLSIDLTEVIRETAEKKGSSVIRTDATAYGLCKSCRTPEERNGGNENG